MRATVARIARIQVTFHQSKFLHLARRGSRKRVVLKYDDSRHLEARERCAAKILNLPGGERDALPGDDDRRHHLTPNLVRHADDCTIGDTAESQQGSLDFG